MDETTKDEALQQAQARIEALEAEVAALKAQAVLDKQNMRAVGRSLAGLVSGLLTVAGDE